MIQYPCDLKQNLILILHQDYIMSQVGNPEGEDKPNKKYFE